MGNIKSILKPKSKKEILPYLDQLNPNDLLVKSSEIRFFSGVKKALGRGANIQTQSDYALRLASWNGDNDIVKLLLEAGADIHIKNKDYGSLFLAYYRGHKETVELLFKATDTKYVGFSNILKFIKF